MTFSFWATAYGITILSSGNLPSGAEQGAETTGLLSIAVGVSSIPLAFLVAAWVSRRPDWPLGVLAAMGLALAVGLPSLALGNPLASLLTGFAAGAVTALQREPGVPWHNRGIAAAGVALVTLVGMQIQPLFWIIAIVGPALPFTAMGLADRLTPDPLHGVTD